MRTDLTNDQCEEILFAQHYGHLGCWDGHEPYVLPITYVYADGFLYGYTQEGRKVDAMRQHPRICIQIENVKNAHDWESVVCWGQFEEVTDEDSRQRVKLMLAEEHGKGVLDEGKDIVSPMVENLHKQEKDNSVVYRMRPDKISGRAEKN
jgi:uncharacterized protein